MTPSDSTVQISQGSSFHHLGGKTEKSPEACLNCTLGDGLISQAVSCLKKKKDNFVPTGR